MGNIGKSFSNIFKGDFKGFFGDLSVSVWQTVSNLAILRYETMSGKGYGVFKTISGKSHTFGPSWANYFMNDTAPGSYRHDLGGRRSGDQFRWAIDQWTNLGNPRFSGPLGISYKIIGTISFVSAGMVQRIFGY